MQKLAVITGGSTGIGHHLVGAVAKAGYRVAFTYHSTAAPAEALAETLRAQGHSVSAHRCDVGDADQVAGFYDALLAETGQAPDLLVNNAGIQTWAPLLELDVEDWDRTIKTNLRGCFLNTQAAARQMKDHGIRGAIVNLGSGCNKLAFPNLVDYTASKGGIEQFTKVSAAELGPYGIRVNCVAPGAIETDRTNEEADGYGDKWSALTPLRRVGRPADLVGPILFLASDAAGFVTGQTLWVDGGVFTQAAWPQDAR
ncbi:SDR family NAD(P)-dependent oxidoreductase [Pseudooctadecabacter jejudonensis]|uniref:3-oxoacyl-[acyl-carrier-protein] reductase FabG n=1 Tax=Pseudooctadecabacter jejudonensis TaxID=1391910 RepID=A0A1Y5R6V0_9RHOB|nr:SDR family NAD(P)-dependent oxidoreductase [Pseudooctadecabacter jejudonensis]SLN10240.1 3-oxoacyl-[acyl-carrier-protein] reductase FabG [Pseudooctadecabacter jejudonensis]